MFKAFKNKPVCVVIALVSIAGSCAKNTESRDASTTSDDAATVIPSQIAGTNLLESIAALVIAKSKSGDGRVVAYIAGDGNGDRRYYGSLFGATNIIWTITCSPSCDVSFPGGNQASSYILIKALSGEINSATISAQFQKDGQTYSLKRSLSDSLFLTGATITENTDVTYVVATNVSQVKSLSINGQTTSILDRNSSSGRLIVSLPTSLSKGNYDIQLTASGSDGSSGQTDSCKGCLKVGTAEEVKAATTASTTTTSTAGGGSTTSNSSTSTTGGSGGSSHTIWVTSTQYDGKLGGIGGANQKCKVRALTAGRTDGPWKAILSTGSVDAVNRIQVNGEVRTAGGDIVATSKSALWDGAIDHLIDKDESNGPTTTSSVWTGTNNSGTAQPDTCTDWSTNVVLSGLTGHGVVLTDARWIAYGTTPCATFLNLFCIGNQSQDESGQ